MPEVVTLELPEPWKSFLAAVDAQLSEETNLHCFGGFVVTVLHGLQRPTADVDLISAGSKSATQRLLEVGGKDSELAKQHRCYLDLVGVADCPIDYESRLIQLKIGLKHLHLFVFEVYDLILSKLARNSPKDREDVKFLAAKHKLSYSKAFERFETEMSWVANYERHKNTLEWLWKEYFPVE